PGSLQGLRRQPRDRLRERRDAEDRRGCSWRPRFPVAEPEAAPVHAPGPRDDADGGARYLVPGEKGLCEVVEGRYPRQVVCHAGHYDRAAGSTDTRCSRGSAVSFGSAEGLLLMQFLVIAHDGTDEGALARRMAVREEHLAVSRAHRANGVLKVGGALLDDAGTMIGSAMVMEAESEEKLRQIL